jgi:hypothetical protein
VIFKKMSIAVKNIKDRASPKVFHPHFKSHKKRSTCIEKIKRLVEEEKLNDEHSV